MKIVAIGGRTGLPVLLRGLKAISAQARAIAHYEIGVAAIVGVADSGGSTGRLRRAFGIPAVGDLRNCLVALAGGDSVLCDIFRYRFPDGDGLANHSLGNLVLTALLQLSGSLEGAIEQAARLLHVEGSVFAVTEVAPTLCAEFEDDSQVEGEAEIAVAASRIRRVWLEPSSPKPGPGVLRAIASANVIILGLGSLYTSVIPNLLVGGVAHAVRTSRALKIFVCNLLTQRGETDNFTAADHLRVLQQYLGASPVDICIVNSQAIDSKTTEKSRAAGSEPVRYDRRQIIRLGALPVYSDLLGDRESYPQHDSTRLARLILFLAQNGYRGERPEPVARPMAA